VWACRLTHVSSRACPSVSLGIASAFLSISGIRLPDKESYRKKSLSENREAT
jgi:hypothetical protein